MKKTISLLAIVLIVSITSLCFAEGTFAPGTYEATVASVGGPLTVSVEVDENTIKSVVVTEVNDTPGVCDAAVERIPAEIVRTQSLGVDAVTGATLTSLFLRNAVTAALQQAGEASKDSAHYAAPAQQNMQADVVVVGGGIAGMSAALAAADRGASVVLLEKNAFIGGDLLISDQAVTMAETGVLFAGWDAALDQLGQMGMGIVPETVEYPGYGVFSQVSIPDTDQPNVSNAYVKNFLKVAEEKGIVILTDTPGIGLLTSDGAVRGVQAQPKGQETFEIEAGAVILATGGFSSNAELVSEYLPYAAGARAVGLGGNRGDALAWVAELDAKLVEMTTDYASFYTVSPSTGYYTEMGTAISHFINLDGTLITDDTNYNIGAMKVYREIGNTPFYSLCAVSECNAPEEYAHMVLAGSVAEFATLDEIIEAYDMPALKQTAEQIALADGPYYIGKSIAGIYGTYGGIQTDADGRVLNNSDAIIPGLYAAGEVMGSRDYQATGVYGGGLGPALATGTYAGNAAASDIAR